MNKIDLTNYIQNNDTNVAKDILHQCHKYGILIIKNKIIFKIFFGKFKKGIIKGKIPNKI